MGTNNIVELTAQADTRTALTFLKSLDANGWHNLVAIQPDLPAGDVNKVIARTFGPSEFDAMHDWIEARQGERNIYFTVNEPKPDSPNRKLKKHDIANVRAVYIDIDPRKSVDFEAERARILSLSNAIENDFISPASAIIDSGGGYQFFWFLDNKIEVTPWAEAQNKALAQAFGGDHIWNIDRLMRLPGTVNLPDAAKRAKGRKRAPTKLVTLNNERYSESFLSKWHTPIEPVARENGKLDVELDIAAYQEVTDWPDLPAQTSHNFKAFIQQNPFAKDIWEGPEDALPSEDKSGSSYLFFLAREMRKSGAFSATEFGMIAKLWERSNLENKPDPLRQITRAWARSGVLSASEEFGEYKPETSSTPTPQGALYAVSAQEAADRAIETNAKPLVKGLLDQGAMSVLYGESNSGKSFVALDIAQSVAAGTPWNGKKTVKGLVIYVVAEGGKSFYKRVAALKRHNRLPDDSQLKLVPCAVDLLHPKTHVGQLCALVAQEEAKAGVPCILIIIDTLSRALAGGDENSSTDMGAIVKNFDVIRSATKAHIMIVHHSGKDRSKGARGHSLLRAATDTELEVADHVILVRKQRDMDFAPQAAFSLTPVPIGIDEDGDQVVSCVVEYRPTLQDDFPSLGAPSSFSTEEHEMLVAMYYAEDAVSMAVNWRNIPKGYKEAGIKAPHTKKMQRIRGGLEAKGFVTQGGGFGVYSLTKEGRHAATFYAENA